MREKRKCAQCGKFLAKDNLTRVCDEDCFYADIFWGTKKDPGVLVTHPISRAPKQLQPA